MAYKKRKTLKNRVLLSMLAIVLLQTFILAGVFQVSDTKNQLDQSYIKMFKDSIKGKAKEMEDQMAEWSDIHEFHREVAALATQLELKRKLPALEALADKETRREFLQDSSGLILKNLRSKEATECFLILEGDGSEKKDAIFLRDLDPKSSSNSNKDILLLAGSSNLMFHNEYALDSNWSSKLSISEEDGFYQTPFAAGNAFSEITAPNLGYWNPPFRLRDTDLEIITYAIPLLDSNHQSYGVIGIGLTLDYLNKYLSTNSISIGDISSYYLGITEDYKKFQTACVSSKYYDAMLGSNDVMKLSSRADKNGLWRVPMEKRLENHVFAYQTLRLYNNNAPFEGQRWVVGGLIPFSSLYEPSSRFQLALLIACIISSTIAIIGASMLTSAMAKPIHTLMQSIGKMKPYDVKLPRTNIKEFDDLVYNIEELSDKVYKAGSRVADILEISSLPLGICEYDEEMNNVFCTKKFLEITELDAPGWENNYISKDAFMPIAETFRKELKKEEGEADIYSFISRNGIIKWLNLKRIKNGRNDLILILDVTRDMEEKRKLCHERDYDVLTNLYNRRAFSRMVSGLIEKKTCRTGVLSIWDLDNLKFINDTYGHDMGDKYICLLADTFASHSMENMIAARMSGDEFMLFLYNYDLSYMYRKFQEIHTDFLKKTLELPDKSPLPVSVSAGMVSIEESESYAELSRFADFAMYEIKNKEKGGIKRFDRVSHLRDYILVQGVGELNRILSLQSIRYAFQPIIKLNGGLFGYEALMRPESDMLKTPDDFLRVAESQSKLNQVEVMTWFNALEQFRQLKKEIPGDAKIFINSIPNQILPEDKATLLYENFSDVLSCTVMEITENTSPDLKYEWMKNKYRSEWKIQCALDDYGSGYSNTDMLVSNEFDYVKMDIGLIHEIDKYPERQRLVSGLIQFCHSRHMKVIAEGIETKEECREVIRLGADYGQGYYFARPSYTLRTFSQDECKSFFDFQG